MAPERGLLALADGPRKGLLALADGPRKGLLALAECWVFQVGKPHLTTAGCTMGDVTVRVLQVGMDEIGRSMDRKSVAAILREAADRIDADSSWMYCSHNVFVDRVRVAKITFGERQPNPKDAESVSEIRTS